MLPRHSAISPDPTRPDDPGTVIGRFWPAADGRELISLADTLDAKSIDVPRDAAIHGLFAPINDDVQRWLHATHITPDRKVGGASIAAVIRAAGETVRWAKQRIADLSDHNDSSGGRKALIEATWQAQDNILELAGQRLGLAANT